MLLLLSSNDFLLHKEVCKQNTKRALKWNMFTQVLKNKSLLVMNYKMLRNVSQILRRCATVWQRHLETCQNCPFINISLYRHTKSWFKWISNDLVFLFQLNEGSQSRLSNWLAQHYIIFLTIQKKIAYRSLKVLTLAGKILSLSLGLFEIPLLCLGQ